jgi:hypothetical protein
MPNDILSRLALIIEFPVAHRVAVGRVQNGLVGKWIAVVHALVMSFRECLFISVHMLRCRVVSAAVRFYHDFDIPMSDFTYCYILRRCR